MSDALVSEARLLRMRAGAETFGRWLDDCVRAGLAALEGERGAIAERVARLHDDQLPGLARWLAFVGERVGETPQWPVVVAGELGRLALLVQAWTRWEDLDDDVRAALLVRSGVVVRREAVVRLGRRIPGLWAVIGQTVSEDDRGLVTRRTSLIGPVPALIVEHAFGGGLATGLPVGVELFAELAMWPAAGAVRAVVVDAEKTGDWDGEGALTLPECLDAIAEAAARDPFVQRLPLAIGPVRVAMYSGRPYVVGEDGLGLPIVGQPWDLVAASLGLVVTVAGQWMGRALLVTGVVADGVFAPIDEVEPAPRDGDEALDARTRALLVGGTFRDLLGAGEHAVLTRAAPVLVAVPVPADVQVGEHRTAPAAWCKVADRVLARAPDRLPLVLEVLREAGRGPGGSLLTRLLDRPSSDWGAIDAVLGPRERRVAALEDRWRWAAPLPVAVGWAEPRLRDMAVHAGLRDAPRDAIAWIVAHGSDLTRAGDRVAVLDRLRPWAQDLPEPWVEAALSDSSKQVRERAADLLAGRAGSGFVRRMTARAREWWPVVGEGRERRLPASLDQSALADGLGPDLSSVDARLGAWRRAVSCTPPSAWGDPHVLVESVVADRDAVRALAMAALRFGDADVGRRFLHVVGNWGGLESLWAELLGLLSVSERVVAVAAVIGPRGDGRLVPGLHAIEAPWPIALVHAWRAGLEAHVAWLRVTQSSPDRAWIDAIDLASARVPIDALPLVLAPVSLPAGHDPLLRQLIAALRHAEEVAALRARLARKWAE